MSRKDRGLDRNGLARKDREIFSPYDKGDKLPGWNPKIRINDGLQEIAKE